MTDTKCECPTLNPTKVDTIDTSTVVGLEAQLPTQCKEIEKEEKSSKRRTKNIPEEDSVKVSYLEGLEKTTKKGSHESNIKADPGEKSDAKYTKGEDKGKGKDKKCEDVSVATKSTSSSTKTTPAGPKKPRPRRCTSADPLYCPYKNCLHIASIRGTIIQHIRRTHFPGLQVMYGHKIEYETTKGEPITFKESSRDLLEEGEEFVPKLISRSKKEPERTLYCPYKGCNLMSLWRGTINDHIRASHCPEFSTRCYTRFILKCPRGTVVTFGKESRNSLNDGEAPLIVPTSQREPDRDNLVYCPYNNCNFHYPTRASLYRHIRKKHDPTFPKLNTQSIHTDIFKNSAGDVIEWSSDVSLFIKMSNVSSAEKIQIVKRPQFRKKEEHGEF